MFDMSIVKVYKFCFIGVFINNFVFWLVIILVLNVK